MSNELLSELQDIFPPIEIALPTRGIFYPQGVLGNDVDPKRIKVGTLGILDEFKYRDPFMLVSGKAMDHLVQHICGNQILIPQDLCEIDLETILLAARRASYGPNLKLVHRCMLPKAAAEQPDAVCEHNNNVLIDLDQFILRYGPIEDESRFEIILPRVGQTVYLKPTPYHTTIEIMRNVMANQRTVDELNEDQDDFMIDPVKFHRYEDLVNLRTELQIQTILDCIYAVRTRSGVLVEDPKEIMTWIFELPKSDHDVIAKHIHDLTEEFRKISLISYQCENCQGMNHFNLQMNAEILFLAEAEDSETPMTFSAPPAKQKNTFRTPSRISRRLP
jgi:hypothetical protein